MNKYLRLIFAGGLAGVVILTLGAPVKAVPINWTNWAPPFTTGLGNLTTGAASGTTPTVSASPIQAVCCFPETLPASCGGLTARSAAAPLAIHHRQPTARCR
jgi:hypothetical protein